MKKTISVLLVLILALSALTGCGSKKQGEDNNKLDVIVTIFPPYDFVRQLAGDKVNLTQLLKPGSESHTYEPTASELLNIQNCDLFICAGGEGDEWVDKILSALETNNVTILRMTDCVELLDEETVEGMQTEEHDHEDGEAHSQEEAESDEHVWTSPKRAVKITQKIADTLKTLDAGNASYYEQNKAAYVAKLNELDKAYSDTISSATGDTIIVADRFPFRYLANDYGLKYFAAFKGCSSNSSDPSASTVKFLADKVKAENIPVVFYIEFSNQTMADTVTEGTNARKALLHSCHNLTADDLKNGETYISLMTANLEQLRTALNY